MLLDSPPSNAPTTPKDAFIHRLPRELILEMLLFFRPRENDRKLLQLRRIIALSTVCRRWRSIIINTPDFWSFVTISIPESEDPARIESHIFAIDKHLQRTGTLALNVVLYLNNMRGDAVIQVLDSISTHAKFNRWRSLSLFGMFVEPEKLVGCGEFENLESLNLMVSPDLSAQLLSIIKATAHKLTALTISRSSMTSSIPLHHLFFTETITSLSIHDAYQLGFRLPASITHLELRNYSCLAGVTQPFDTVKHLKADTLRTGNLAMPSAAELFPNVKFIEAGLEPASGAPLYFSELCHLVALNSRKGSFTSLRAPKLAILHLTGWHNLSDFMVAKSQDEGRRHLDPTHLILEINVVPSTMTDILTVYPRLERLRLYFRANWLNLDFIGHALTVEEGGIWRYCSQLTELEITLDREQKEKEAWPAVAERLIEVRRNAPLHTVRINWSCGAYAIYTDHSWKGS